MLDATSAQWWAVLPLLAVWSAVGWWCIAWLSARRIERRWLDGHYDKAQARSLAIAVPMLADEVEARLEDRLAALQEELPERVRLSLQGLLGGVASGVSRRGDALAADLAAVAAEAGAEGAGLDVSDLVGDPALKRALRKNPWVGQVLGNLVQQQVAKRLAANGGNGAVSSTPLVGLK